MDKKIQQLTEKIYQEGVEKGNSQATQIISEATAKAQAIESDAQKQAEKIIADAQRKADELKQNTISELKLYAGQSVEALKSEIANLLTDKLAGSAVEAAMSDKEFMQSVILALVSEWSKKEELVIEAEDSAELMKFFELKAEGLLNGGVKIEHVNGKNAEFSVSPVDGSYKITFGENEFVNYFKEFLRPQLIELLFSK